MKFFISTVLVALLFGFVVSANARPENIWIKVKGGAWTPTAETIQKVKEQIRSYMKAKAKVEGRNLHEWSSYTFQYQGQEEHGNRFVFVNAFCVNNDSWKSNKQMVLVMDGRTCFFSVKYNPANGKFFGLLINGEA